MSTDSATRSSALRGRLRAIAPGAPLCRLFEALGASVPAAGGFVDRFCERDVQASVFEAVGLSDVAVSRIMSERTSHGPALGVMAAAPCGRVVRDRDVPGIDWQQFSGYRVLGETGVGEPAAMKLRSAPLGHDREHLYLAVVQRAGDPPLTRQACAVLRAAWREILGAVERLRLPLIGSDELFAQVAAEKRLGLVCLDAASGGIEANATSYELLARFSPAFAPRGIVGPARLAAWLEEAFGAEDGAVAQLHHPTEPCVLRASQHWIYGGSSRTQAARLLVLQEHAAAGFSPALAALPPRLREVAGWLALTGHRASAIAAALGVSPHTLRTHAQHLYAALGVSSRQGLRLRIGQRTPAS